MKTRLLASIVTGILVSSAAHAGSSLSIEETYSPSAPSQVAASNDLDISSYYTMPASLQQAAHKTTCTWQVTQYDLNPLRVVYAEEPSVESIYLASPNLRLVC